MLKISHRHCIPLQPLLSFCSYTWWSVLFKRERDNLITYCTTPHYNGVTQWAEGMPVKKKKPSSDVELEKNSISACQRVIPRVQLFSLPMLLTISHVGCDNSLCFSVGPQSDSAQHIITLDCMGSQTRTYHIFHIKESLYWFDMQVLIILWKQWYNIFCQA